MWLFWMVVMSWSLDVALLLLSLYRFLIIYVHRKNSAEHVMYLVFLVGEFNKFFSSQSFKLGATLNMRYKYFINLFIKLLFILYVV